MRSLIQFFIRYGTVLVFIFLEVFCFSLIIQFNTEQRNIYLTSSNKLIGTLYEKYDGLIRYWNLSEVSDSLARENARLKSRLNVEVRRKAANTDTITDTDTAYAYRFIPARVLNNSINLRNNTLTINKGKAQGVQPGMGVIDKRGIVGVVRKSSENFSVVLSLLHAQSRFSAAVRGSNYFGTLHWETSDPNLITLHAIPKHAEIQIGDTIETSGYSSIFPRGELIGTIRSIDRNPGSNFYEISVRLTNDLSNLEYVYVVDYLFRKERKELKAGPGDE